jgi:uncharacterized protein (TIGR02145 family)
MKRLLTLIVILTSLSLSGQVPELISFQAVVRSATGRLIVNQQVGIRLSILKGSATGSVVYMETHTVKSNANGLITLQIGAGDVVSGVFSSIPWTSGPYYVKCETDLNGGTNYTMTSTSQLISVPFALHAKSADITFEYDPIFTASVAFGITVADTAKWNSMTVNETDPVFTAWDKSTGISITESQISNLKPYLLTESDPLFSGSVASTITGADIINWNNKISLETDPVFTAWDKSTGISITESQISNLKPYLLTESDPLFSGSVASTITGADIINWNNKISLETDPVFTAWDKSTGISITESQISNLKPYLLTESDPVFTGSVAGGITSLDTAKWNNMTVTEIDPVFTAWDKSTGISITESQISNLKPYLLTESDPLFSGSVAGGITSIDTAKWNNMTCVETDPVFNASVAGGITSTDTAKWNNMTAIEVDPYFTASVASGITGTDTANWNQKAMIPGTNPGEMLYWDGTTWVMVPSGSHGQIMVFCNGVPTWGGCLPVVTTGNVSGITGSSATVDGTVINDGGSFVSERGICWDLTNPQPTISGNHLAGGSGTGPFQVTISGLSNNTTYYARAYATNTAGTSYGSEVSFTTTTVVVPPPQCNFSANPTSTQVNTSVQFTDLSANIPTSWLWDFGDGNGSTAQNPAHSYANPGIYSVSLTVSNSAGSDAMTKTNYITVTAPPTTGQPCPGMATVTDIDGNVYNTVQIGNQCWLKENLKTTRYNNGTSIPIVPDNLNWSISLTPAMCWFNNDSASYHQTYGPLYNWHAVNTGNLCPLGWHAATSDEWDTLSDFVGGVPGPLKEIGLLHWASPNSGATNQTGFTALPGGGRDGNSGGFGNFSLHGEFWTSSATTTTNAVSYQVHYTHNILYRYSSIMRDGKSVRCIADTATTGSSPVSDFSANPLITNPNSPVQFTDLSTNSPTSWKWYFGDGMTSTQQNPSHSYTSAGTYSVSLVVTNAFGSDSLTKTNYITVTAPPPTGQPCPGMATVTDYNGNLYNTVQIGNQCWMKENLRTTKYNNGISIPIVPDNLTWSMSLTPAMCWYNNDSTSYKQTYGALYNWYSVSAGSLCPVGWHVPSDSEWTILVNYLGGDNIAGGKMKEIGILHWSSPNGDANNISGFTALPGGYRADNSGAFIDMTNYGHFWSTTSYSTYQAWFRTLRFGNGSINPDATSFNMRAGLSVRCVADQATAGLSPVSDFSATPTTVQVNSSVQFSDLSTNNPTSWLWDFGDGMTSTQQNPSHSYTSAGTYSISLLVTNTFGSDSLMKTNYITVIPAPQGSAPVYDIDGNGYDTVHIGAQVWMKQNLKTTKYNNGVPIPIIENNLTWSMTLAPAMCWLNNDSGTYNSIYGALYNWYTVNTGILCPNGWHVPTDTEWNTLVNYIGGDGGTLKEIGILHWAPSPNGGVTNSTGFTALPAGGRHNNNAGYQGLTEWTGFWASTLHNSAKVKALTFTTGTAISTNPILS